MIPMGRSCDPGTELAKTWCPKCHDIYDCDSGIDGAFFGPDLPIMFHKIANIPLRFRAHSKLLGQYRREDGEIVPDIKQRLFRWGEGEV
jgi:hypothetical protein